MQVISLDQVKAQLGIADSSQDAAISAQLPFIDAKVKQITNNRWDYRFGGDTVNASNIVTAYALSKGSDNYPSGVNNDVIVRDITKTLEIGMLVEGDGIQSDTHITNYYKSGSTESFYSAIDTIYIELSKPATADGSVVLTAGISIAYHNTIAKGVQYMLNETSTTLPESGEWSTKKMGPLSISKGSTGEYLDGRYGMPTWFVKSLPRYI